MHRMHGGRGSDGDQMNFPPFPAPCLAYNTGIVLGYDDNVESSRLVNAATTASS